MLPQSCACNGDSSANNCHFHELADQDLITARTHVHRVHRAILSS